MSWSGFRLLPPFNKNKRLSLSRVQKFTHNIGMTQHSTQYTKNKKTANTLQKVNPKSTQLNPFITQEKESQSSNY
jgi:hypothetical protein